MVFSFVQLIYSAKEELKEVILLAESTFERFLERLCVGDSADDESLKVVVQLCCGQQLASGGKSQLCVVFFMVDK